MKAGEKHPMTKNADLRDRKLSGKIALYLTEIPAERGCFQRAGLRQSVGATGFGHRKAVIYTDVTIIKAAGPKEREAYMLKTGIRGNYEMEVTEEQLAVNVGSGSVHVFATPMMVAWIEHTAAASVAAELPEGKTTVGTLVNVSHVAASPVGMKLRFETELTEISANGKILSFQVAAYDEGGVIGEGTHQRAVVDRARFEEKATMKLTK